LLGDPGLNIARASIIGNGTRTIKTANIKTRTGIRIGTRIGTRTGTRTGTRIGTRTDIRTGTRIGTRIGINIKTRKTRRLKTGGTRTGKIRP
jgi:UDP-3-O-[3-hydroxymyristoyl] glucosamine N-acyltransferase